MLLNNLTKLFAPLSAVIIFAVSSCVKPEETVTSREAELSIPLNPVPTKAASQFVTVDAEGAWTLSIDFGEAEEAWARVDTESGEGRRSDIVLSWDRNASEDSRSCTLTLSAGARTVSATFTQSGTSGSGGGGSSEIKADVPGKWLELPATDDESLYFITHEMPEGSGLGGRNFSYYYSPDDKLAVWVAYPLYRGVTGSSGRTNEWGYDPKVPAKYQPNLNRGYAGGYDRGHQMPSGDRTRNRTLNETTFYFTNMTPQLGRLNQQKWAELENHIRNWSSSLDTLYVVTGADIHGAAKVAYDNNGEECTVPEGYFKALLGYKKGGSISNATGGYIGIAFYFEHRSYSNDIMDQSMSIDELENKLGYDFFVNLPGKIGEEVAARVESEADDWWY